MPRIMRLLAVFGMLLGLLVTAVPVSAADFYFGISVKNPYPAQYSEEVVFVRLAGQRGGVEPFVGIPVHSVWNYRTTTAYVDWYTGNDGVVALIRNISDATCGYTVRVDLYIGNDQRQIDSAFFTPCGQNAPSVSPSPSSSFTPTFITPTQQRVDDAANGCYVPPDGPLPPCSGAYAAPPQSSGPISGSGGVCPGGYPIKANDNSGIYHVPGGEFYDATNARNCFPTEGAAQTAGYRRSQR